MLLRQAIPAQKPGTYTRDLSDRFGSPTVSDALCRCPGSSLLPTRVSQQSIGSAVGHAVTGQLALSEHSVCSRSTGSQKSVNDRSTGSQQSVNDQSTGSRKSVNIPCTTGQTFDQQAINRHSTVSQRSASMQCFQLADSLQCVTSLSWLVADVSLVGLSLTDRSIYDPLVHL